MIRWQPTPGAEPLDIVQLLRENDMVSCSPSPSTSTRSACLLLLYLRLTRPVHQADPLPSCMPPLFLGNESL